MPQCLVKLSPNRVRRNYKGGAGIDRLQGKKLCQDTNRPEEWLGSLVEAKNSGMESLCGEGLSKVSGSGVYLKDILKEAPSFYLGKALYEKNGLDLGFLFKLLDSSMRLHVQAHPTAAFAQANLNSKYGKLECYYILDIHEGTDPYIRLGFQKPVTRVQWRDIVERQDILSMDALFEKIPVHKGEVWCIPGGMPHAIGEGILMLEMMEPTDWVVRCEFEREGILVPENARYMGRDLDFCLQIFNYTPRTVEEIQRRYKITPTPLKNTPFLTVEQLVGPAITHSFESRRASLRQTGALDFDGKPAVGVVCKNSLQLECYGEKMALTPGESFFVAAGAGKLTFQTEHEAEVCFMLPGA